MALIRPSFLLLVLLGFQSILISGFYIGLIPSFRLSPSSLSEKGFTHFLLFNFLTVGVMAICETIKWPYLIPKILPRRGAFVNNFLPLATTMALLGIGIYGLLNVIIRLEVGRITELFISGIQGQLRPKIPWGQGLTIRHVALQVAVIIAMVIVRSHLWRVLVVSISLVGLTIYSVAYMSRIMILAPLVALTVIYINFQSANKQLPRKVLFIGSLILVLLILLQGYRDFAAMGVYYTNNIIIWGVTRLTDYFLSTALYSIYLASFHYIGASLDIHFALGTPEYVNLGSLGQLLVNFGMFYPIVVIVFCILVSIYWKKFRAHRTDGLIVYPFMIYSLLEFPRIFEFATVTGLVRLGTILICGWLFSQVTPRSGLLSLQSTKSSSRNK